jgi:hypothetical protein
MMRIKTYPAARTSLSASSGKPTLAQICLSSAIPTVGDDAWQGVRKGVGQEWVNGWREGVSGNGLARERTR